ncbi:MAG TPA: M48 family metalloprotease, partial [Pseudomonadales bacterium]|nr:M48 family metalloprotease [Pseudomonadales bacterium]
MFFARIIGNIVDNALRSNSDQNNGPGIGYYITSIIAELVLGIAASMIVAWFSRRREFRADHAGASLAGRLSMINALRRLQAEQELPSQMPASMTAFGIASGTGRSLAHLFATHPPLDERIKALQEAR